MGDGSPLITSPRPIETSQDNPRKGSQPLGCPPEASRARRRAPGQIIGPGAPLFRSPVALNSRPHLGQQAGDIDDWSNSIGEFAKLSNYCAFAIMAALAAPLLRIR